MEYVYFVSFIAALGLVLIAFWRMGIAWSKDGSSFFSRQANIGPHTEPAPPFKRTISGLAEKELEEIRFKEKLENSQKHIGVQLEGKRYSYVPQQKSRITRRHKTQKTNGTQLNLHKWQLVG